MAETGGSSSLDNSSADHAPNDAKKSNEKIVQSVALEDEQASKHQQSDVSEQLNEPAILDVLGSVLMPDESCTVDDSSKSQVADANAEVIDSDTNPSLSENLKNVNPTEKASDDDCVKRQVEHLFGDVSDSDEEKIPQRKLNTMAKPIEDPIPLTTEYGSKNVEQIENQNEKIVPKKPYDGRLSSSKDGPMNAGGMLALGMHFVSESFRRPLSDEFDHLSGGLHIMMTKWLNSSTENRMALKNLHIGKRIGHGSCAYVYSAFFNKKHVALKQFKKNVCRPEDVYKERDIMLSLNHRNVRKLLGAFHEGHSYLVMEICVGTVMQARLGASQAHLHCWIVQLIRAVEYIHSKEIVHCDLKPDNCLVTTTGCLKLSDFGAAILLPEGATTIQSHRSFGVAAYQDAETNQRFIHSKSKDIFSMACTIYEIETQRGFLKYTINGVKPTANDYIDAYYTGRKVALNAEEWSKSDVEKKSLLSRADTSKYSAILKLMITEPRIGAKEALQKDLWSESSKVTASMLATGFAAPNSIKFESSKPIKIDQDPKMDMLFQVMSLIYYDSEEIVDSLPVDESAYKSAEAKLVTTGENDALTNLRHKLATVCSKREVLMAADRSASDTTGTKIRNAENQTTDFNEKRAKDQSVDGTNAEETDCNPDVPPFTQRSPMPGSSVVSEPSDKQSANFDGNQCPDMKYVDLAEIIQGVLLNVFSISNVRIPLNSAEGVADALTHATKSAINDSARGKSVPTTTSATAAPTVVAPTVVAPTAVAPTAVAPTASTSAVSAPETAPATSLATENFAAPTPKRRGKKGSKQEAKDLTGIYKDLATGPVPKTVDAFRLPSKTGAAKPHVERALSPLREGDGVAPEAPTILPKGAKGKKQSGSVQGRGPSSPLVRAAANSTPSREEKSPTKRKVTTRERSREAVAAKRTKIDDQSRKKADELQQQRLQEAEEKSRKKREAERKRLEEAKQKEEQDKKTKKKGKGAQSKKPTQRGRNKRVVEETDESSEGKESNQSEEGEKTEEDDVDYECRFCKFKCDDEEVCINHMKKTHPKEVKEFLRQPKSRSFRK